MKSIIKKIFRILGLEVSRYNPGHKSKESEVPVIDQKYLFDTYITIADTLVKIGRYEDGAEMYKKAIGIQPASPYGYSVGMKLARQGNFNDDFYRSLLKVIKTPEINLMYETLLKSPEAYHPSKLWLYFMVIHTFQLETGGIENFKRTLNNNYFNWTTDWNVQPQIQALKEALHWSDNDLLHAEKSVNDISTAKPEGYTNEEWREYTQLLCLLWEFAVNNDRLEILKNLKEPMLGNPIGICYKDNFITQDLCNSVVEVNTIMEFVTSKPGEKLRIMELGAGHGRVANVLLHAAPNIQVVIVDIPPTLYVSQWYLTSLYPGHRIFKFRDFSDYNEIKQEFEASSIAFLSPAQVELLPDRTFDVFINISSLHEMNPGQISMWFDHIDRLCKGLFYTKQWFESDNYFDGIVIRREDYPVKPHWKELLNRTNLIYPRLFETIYKIH